MRINIGRSIAGVVVVCALMAVPLSSRAPTETPRVAAVSPALDYVAVAPALVEPASEESPVGSEVIGVLSSVSIEENDTVAAGQIVAIVKNDDQKALLAQGAAQVSIAQANLNESMISYNRKVSLMKTLSVPEADVETARYNLDAAKGELEKAEALRQQALANLEKTFIRTPISGVVLKKYVVAGMAVSNQPPTQIAVIGDLTTLRVRAEVDELDIAKLHEGQRVEIRTDSFPDLRATGRVIRISKKCGLRSVLTDRSNERIDSKVLQTLIELDRGIFLPIGLRVDAYFLLQNKDAPRRLSAAG